MNAKQIAQGEGGLVLNDYEYDTIDTNTTINTNRIWSLCMRLILLVQLI